MSNALATPARSRFASSHLRNLAAQLSRLVIAAAACAALLTGCGKSGANSITGPGPVGGGSGGSGSGTGTMSATVDGATWTAASGPNTPVAGYKGNGTYIFSGGSFSGGHVESIQMMIDGVHDLGTYPLGVVWPLDGGEGAYAYDQGEWWTSLSGAAGTVTITSLSRTRIAGTFEFLADSVSGSAAGSRRITNGHFDLPITVLDTTNAALFTGGHVRAKLDGAAWNAAGALPIVLTASPAPMLVIGAGNSSRQMAFAVSPFNGAGTYDVQPGGGTRFTIEDPATGAKWGGPTGGSGSIVITSITTTRLIGTFAVDLAPVPGTSASGTLHVTEGSFDLGLPPATQAAAPPARIALGVAR